jgi:acetyl esterase
MIFTKHFNYYGMKRIIIFVIFIGMGCNKIEIYKPTISPRNGAAFLKTSNIIWASPKGFDLTMDIYVPNSGKESYPVIIMYHGGGWLLNDKSVLNDASAYLAANSEFIVCNVNFRNLGDQGNTVKMNEIIEDAFGSVLWVKENIGKYKGDKNKITVCGDSSGGQMALLILTQGRNLDSDGFAGANIGYRPTYLPEAKKAEDIARENGLKVQAAIINYGVFDVYDYAISDNKTGLSNLENEKNSFWFFANKTPRGIFGDSINIQKNPEYYKQVSPIYTIKSVKEGQLPPILFNVGSIDYVTTPTTVTQFIGKLFRAGHKNTDYWVNPNKNHAYMESGSNPFLGTNFIFDAPPALEKKINFLNKIFY